MKPPPVQIDHCTALGRARLRGVIDSNQNLTVRPAGAKVLDLANRGLRLIDECVMLTALDMNGLVRTKNWPRLKPIP